MDYHLLTILHVGAQRSSPELLSLDREINVLQTCLLKKKNSFEDFFQCCVLSSRWLSMLSSHLSLGLPLGLCPFIFDGIATLSVNFSSVRPRDMTKPSKFVLIDYLNNGHHVVIGMAVNSGRPFFCE